jgi:hypothetical protein
MAMCPDFPGFAFQLISGRSRLEDRVRGVFGVKVIETGQQSIMKVYAAYRVICINCKTRARSSIHTLVYTIPVRSLDPDRARR